MADRYYIDGYNLIHCVPGLRGVLQQNFESARDSLIDMVAHFCSATGHSATILFDGRGRRPEPMPPFSSAPGLEVVYSPGHQTADTLIERLVYNAANRRSIVVVTGDQGIRDLCGGLGALVMGPENFLDAVERASAGVRSSLRRSFQSTAPERIEDGLDEMERASLDRLKKKLKKEGL